MLRIENLAKRFGPHVLFQNLTGQFGPGCVALCDENGSGKSTLLNVLAGELDLDQGDVWIGAYSLRTEADKAKSALAYVPDDCMVSPSETGRALLERVAATKHAVIDDNTWAWAERFGLAPHLDKRFEQMSLGTRRKCFLAAATIGEPAVLFADEPTNGLDKPSRDTLIAFFKTLAKERLVFFSSHDLAIVQSCEARQISFADLRAPG